MEFNSIEKKEEGKFITRYDITYTTVDHKKKASGSLDLRLWHSEPLFRNW